jgi:ATP-binding cassette subfamily B protein
MAADIHAALQMLGGALQGAGGFDPRHSERSFVLAATDYTACVLLPPLMAKLAMDAPKVHVRVVSSEQHVPVADLASGQLDFAVGFTGDQPDLPGQILSHRWFEDDYVVLLRQGHPLLVGAWGEVTNVLADTIPGIRVVKAFAQEQREAQRFRDANRQNLLVNDKLNKTWSLFSPTVALLTEVGRLVVWGFGIWLIAGHAITVGTLIAFIGLISRFYTRLDSMSRIVSVTQKAAAGAKRIFDILDQRSNVPEPEHPVPLPKVLGQVEMRDVGFRYGNRAVIRGLNLSIRPGEMIGLVGHSGSGKSTLVNLICRFYDVTEGSIMVDGHDVRRFAVSDFRRHIGLVLQEPFLFFGTIAENIAYGKPDATREEIVAAARAAHAHEFILRLPHGYDSLVGERGQGLSGGERQRISIARALLINPRVLIMDEATSAVDTETEKEIQKALDNLVKGRTTIAIAHRLSTLRKADRLVVMDRGQVVEVGPHDELMAKQGAYWRLYEAQARRVDQEDELVVSPHPVNAHPAGQA